MSLYGSDQAEGMNLPEGMEFFLSPRLLRSTQGVEVMGKLTASKWAAPQRLSEHRQAAFGWVYLIQGRFI